MKREEYKKLRAQVMEKEPTDTSTEEEDAFSDTYQDTDQDTYKEAFKEILHHRGFWVMVTLLVIMSGVLFYVIQLRESLEKTESDVDFTQVISDVAYTLALEEGDDYLIGYVASDELAEVDAVTLADVIQEEKDTQVRLYVFEEEEPQWIEPDFYTTGLRYTVQTYVDNRYETTNFYPVPSITGDIESVKDWTLDAEESYVDTHDVLHVSTRIPPLATPEETVAFLKEMSGTIKDLNEDVYSNIIFDIKSGVSAMAYSANHQHVLADVQVYQMEKLGKGE